MERLCMRKWLLQHGVSDHLHSWSLSDPCSQAYSWLGGTGGHGQHPGRSFLLPQFWGGNTLCLENSQGLKLINISRLYTSDLSTGIWALADSRKQVLSTSFSTHSHINRQPPYSEPAAASGWSCQEVPTGMQCSHVGWCSHSSSKHLWEKAKVCVLSMLQAWVENQSKT